VEVPLTPLALVGRGFALHGQRPAVLDDGLAWSYAALRARVERLAGALRGMGIGAGDRVALLAPNTAEAFACYTGVPLAGATLVPLNTRLAPADLAFILRHSGSRLLLADASLMDVARAVLAEVPDLRLVGMGTAQGEYGTLLESAEPVPFDPERVGERDILSVNYTSGTTARPKGVMQTHRNNYLNAVNMLLALRVCRDDVHLHVAPMFHANGWGMIWATLAMGAANVMLPRVDPADIFRRMEQYGVTTLCAAATVLTMLLEHAPAAPARGPSRRVRVAVAGMAPPAEVIRRVEAELGWTVVHMYGLTETTAFATYHEPAPEVDHLAPPARAAHLARQGVPLPLSGAVRVVRGDLTDVAPDGQELGEVVVRGNVVMAGYYDDQAATDAAFAGGWFHTGDLAVRHPDGYIEIRDRAKDLIVSGGENISSLEVEGVLYRHPAVAQAAVVAGPHPLWGETPVAFVALRRGAHADPAALIAFCRAQLPHFKAPTRVVLVDELPRTASGKIQKHLLRERLRSPATGDRAAQAPGQGSAT
jgi:fatty-acyl-CoA synthase